MLEDSIGLSDGVKKGLYTKVRQETFNPDDTPLHVALINAVRKLRTVSSRAAEISPDPPRPSAVRTHSPGGHRRTMKSPETPPISLACSTSIGQKHVWACSVECGFCLLVLLWRVSCCWQRRSWSSWLRVLVQLLLARRRWA